MSRCVLVIGPHRSGTSLVAGILHTLGVSMGEELLGESEANPKGHFEDLLFLKKNDLVVGDWKDPNPGEVSEGFYKYLIKTRLRLPLWGIKDPRLCFTTPFILPHLDEVRFICTHRNALSSTQSLMERDGLSREEAGEITKRYIKAQSKLVLSHPEIPVLHVIFEELLRTPEKVVAEIRDFAIPFRAAVDFVIPRSEDLGVPLST